MGTTNTKHDLSILNGLRFKEALRQMRKNTGMSQLDLARTAGVAQPVVSDWENGVFYPHITTLAKLEQIFGVPRGELLIRAAYEQAADGVHRRRNITGYRRRDGEQGRSAPRDTDLG